MTNTHCRKKGSGKKEEVTKKQKNYEDTQPSEISTPPLAISTRMW
jgi:hypothetical protein